MVLQEVVKHVQTALSCTILTTCQEAIPFMYELHVEGVVNIIVDRKDTFVISISDCARNSQDGPIPYQIPTNCGVPLDMGENLSGMHQHMFSENEENKSLTHNEVVVKTEEEDLEVYDIQHSTDLSTIEKANNLCHDTCEATDAFSAASDDQVSDHLLDFCRFGWMFKTG